MNGRPILGVVSGFLFGLFLGISLFLWGVIPFHAPLMWILPIVGIVLGLIMAAWAPFGSAAPATAAVAAETADDPAPSTPPPVADTTEEE